MLEAALRVEELPRFPTPEASATASVRERLRQSALTDDAFMEVKERAAARLLPHRPDLAPVVAAAMTHASLGTAQELGRLLDQSGHGELAAKVYQEMNRSIGGRDFSQRLGDLREAIAAVVRTIAELAEPADLSPADTRRLPTLASFLEAIDYNREGGWPGEVSADDLRASWYRLVAQLSDLDLGRLAAEARVLQGEMTADDHEPLFSLLGLASADPTRWDLDATLTPAQSLRCACSPDL